MIGGLVAIVIAYGFYQAAERRKLPGFQWAFGGVLVFYVPNFIWSLMVAKPMMNELHAQNAAGPASLLGFSSVLVGAVAAGLVYWLTLRRLNQGPGV